MNKDEAKVLEQIAADAAIKWAKTGMGYFAMEDAVNKYIDAVPKTRSNDSTMLS